MMNLTPITDLELALLRANPKRPLRATVHVVAVVLGPNPFGSDIDWWHVTCIWETSLSYYTGQWRRYDSANLPTEFHCEGCGLPLNQSPMPYL